MNKTTTSPFIKLDTTSADQQRSKENTMKNKYELKLKLYFHMKTRKAWIYVFAFPPLKPWTERGSEAKTSYWGSCGYIQDVKRFLCLELNTTY